MCTIPAEEIFQKYFTIQVAHSKQQIEDCFRLRYQVFCEEFGFEDKKNFTDNKEYDDYDEMAKHIIVYHKNGSIAGCLRILYPQRHPLPFEPFVHSRFKTWQQEPPFHHVEISRMAVSPFFRRRQVDGHHPSGINTNYLIRFENTDEALRAFPLVAVTLMLAGVSLPYLEGIESAYAMMEPKLVYIMHQYGIHFQQIGELTEYHGKRAAYVMDPQKTLKTIHSELMPLLNCIYSDLKGNTSQNNECA